MNVPRKAAFRRLVQQAQARLPAGLCEPSLGSRLGQQSLGQGGHNRCNDNGTSRCTRAARRDSGRRRADFCGRYDGHQYGNK